jgi:hypothetical protein
MLLLIQQFCTHVSYWFDALLSPVVGINSRFLDTGQCFATHPMAMGEFLQCLQDKIATPTYYIYSRSSYIQHYLRPDRLNKKAAMQHYSRHPVGKKL